MDEDIRDESKPLNTNKLSSLFEYEPKYPSFKNIVDEGVLDPYDETRKRVEKIREASESRGTVHPYPWEDQEYTPENTLPSSTEPKKDYVKKVYVIPQNGNLSSDQTIETVDTGKEKRIVIKSNKVNRPGAKLKGRRTIIYSYNSRGNYSAAATLAFSPIADRTQAAIEIAKIKRDPGYQNWAKNIALYCGGDEFLFRLYDLCVDLKCSFRDMMFVIAAECGFKPFATNKSSNAQGLIQFLPPEGTRNYSKYGFGNRRPADFSAVQQLPYVKRYYEGRDYYDTYKQKFGTGIPNLTAAYTYVAGGNTYDYFSKFLKPNTPIYTDLGRNSGWDYNGDGRAYAWEITDYAIRRWYQTKRGERLPPGNSWSADGETIGMKIWDLRNNRPRR